MRALARLGLVGIAGAVGCLAAPQEPRGATRAQYAGDVLVKFTNASAERMCALFMSFDPEDDHGDNWLPAQGVPPGGSIDLRVKPGKYKARWNTCKEGKGRPYYAATLWHETAFVVERQTQLYAYVPGSVAPTQHAAVLTRDYQVVHFVGQAIDPDPKQQQPLLRRAPQVAEREPEGPPPIAGFIGLYVLGPEQVADRKP